MRKIILKSNLKGDNHEKTFLIDDRFARFYVPVMLLRMQTQGTFRSRLYNTPKMSEMQ